ncbi:hypothetical protein B296_00055591, partial [Ensete ventricosum]
PAVTTLAAASFAAALPCTAVHNNVVAATSQPRSPATAALAGLPLPSSFLHYQSQPNPCHCLHRQRHPVPPCYCCSSRPKHRGACCFLPSAVAVLTTATPAASSRRSSLSSPRPPTTASSSPPASLHLLPSATTASVAATFILLLPPSQVPATASIFLSSHCLSTPTISLRPSLTTSTPQTHAPDSIAEKKKELNTIILRDDYRGCT